MHIVLGFLSQYDPDTNNWIMLPVQLKTGLEYVGALLLDEDNIPC